MACHVWHALSSLVKTALHVRSLSVCLAQMGSWKVDNVIRVRKGLTPEQVNVPHALQNVDPATMKQTASHVLTVILWSKITASTCALWIRYPTAQHVLCVWTIARFVILTTHYVLYVLQGSTCMKADVLISVHYRWWSIWIAQNAWLKSNFMKSTRNRQK